MIKFIDTISENVREISEDVKQELGVSIKHFATKFNMDDFLDVQFVIEYLPTLPKIAKILFLKYFIDQNDNSLVNNSVKQLVELHKTHQVPVEKIITSILENQKNLANEIVKKEEKLTNNLGIIDSFKEKLLQVDCQYKQKLKRSDIIIGNLEEQIQELEEELLKQRKKQIVTEELLKNSLHSTRMRQDVDYSTELKGSINDILEKQIPVIEQNLNRFEEVAKTEISIEKINKRVEEFLGNKFVEEEKIAKPVVSAQHFYLLHQIIGSQQKEIDALKTLMTGTNASTPAAIDNTTKKLEIEFAQAKKDHNSLTDKIKVFEDEIKEYKQKLELLNELNKTI